MLRYKARWIIIIGMLIVLLISGCSNGVDGTNEIDPPPADANLDLGEWDFQAAMAAGSEAEMAMTLYFKDAQNFVVPVSVQVPETATPARKALEYMVEDGPGQRWLPAGFKALLPKGTEVIGINIIEPEKLAIVDFSEHFTSYNVQDERKILEAITWSLTQFDSIDQVNVWVNGEPLEEMPVGATPIAEPLTRANGINLERDEGIHLGQASSVTLYFQNQLDNGTTYMVPVTRLVQYTDNLPLATLESLIRGPLNEHLSSVIMPSAKVIDIQRQDRMITVNLDESVLNPESQASPETIMSVVLSLTESTDAETVQIKVEGSSQVLSTDGADYSMPVARPNHVNQIEL